MRGHSQNLNEGPDGNPKGSKLWHGRAWWWFSERHVVRTEWCLGRFARHAGIGLEVGGGDADREVLVSYGVPGLLNLYLGFEHVPWGLPHRSVEVKFHDQAVWWRLWADPDCWESSRPRWRDGSWHPLDTFLGRHEVTRRPLEVARVEIEFPERHYPATITIEEMEWRRPRWPFPIRLVAADIEPDVPVPIPGKGENSWDCGDDYIASLHTKGATTVPEAVQHFRERVRAARRRRGGEDWRPTPEHIAMCERSARGA